MISEKARHYAVRAQQIKIEVTERGFIDVPKTTPVIQAFRQAGYEVAIDDFGTGYSNLHNLYSLNVDILKIDKSFIDTLTTNSTSHLIAEHIIEMAQSLRLKTIAEGVETAEQVSWLLKRGVQFCQGWHFAKAMPPREFMTAAATFALRVINSTGGDSRSACGQTRGETRGKRFVATHSQDPSRYQKSAAALSVAPAPPAAACADECTRPASDA